MRERSAEEQPPKLKTYMLKMRLIKLSRNYTTYSTGPLCPASSSSSPRAAVKYPLLTLSRPKGGERRLIQIKFGAAHKIYHALHKTEDIDDCWQQLFLLHRSLAELKRTKCLQLEPFRAGGSAPPNPKCDQLPTHRS